MLDSLCFGSYGRNFTGIATALYRLSLHTSHIACTDTECSSSNNSTMKK